MSGWQAAFEYGMRKFVDGSVNSFSRLDKFKSPPRRQRWTDEQLEIFVNRAIEMGHPSIGLCALICMDLVQRPKLPPS
jgi:hypothetical protein